MNGLWQDAGETIQDDLVVFRVRIDSLDAEWWAACRAELERRFRQEEVVVRAQEIRRL